MIKRLPLFLLTAFSLPGAALSVGVLGGAPFTDLAKNTAIGAVQSIPQSANFTVGPVVQVNLPASFRIEADALFRPYKVDLVSSVFKPTTTTHIEAQQWRFPVLLQYRFSGIALLHPYVGAGLSFGHLSGISTAAKNILSGPGQLLHQSDVGPVVGGGLDVGLPLVRISAEIRYTYQTISNFANISNPNQVEVLLGIHF